MNTRRTARTDMIIASIRIMENLGVTRILSRQLMPALQAMPPWNTWYGPGKPMPQGEIVKLMKSAGIKIRHVRNKEAVSSGVWLEDLVAAHGRSVAREGTEGALTVPCDETPPPKGSGPQRTRSEKGSPPAIRPNEDFPDSEDKLQTLGDLRGKAMDVLAEVLNLNPGEIPDPNDRDGVSGFIRIQSARLDAAKEVLKTAPPVQKADPKKILQELEDYLDHLMATKGVAIEEALKKFRKDNPQFYPSIVDAETNPPREGEGC
ncbi:hypothetical protein [Leptospirillum ferriphilum]|uniref:Uncharacterized protein n=3 Tax=Leptospirillum TaxID=179 RepID=A0A2I2MEN7_9BACT|nr:hypothetical protein [Leptospirillum ferriphilum]EDZ39405.1 MAG: Hypothetical protein CGL2_11277040 [Leptospirillum sp. Group II '5-way CG']